MKKRINNWLSPKLEPRNSEKHGKGIFAIQDISKDETMAIFGGHIITREERNLLPENIGHISIGIDDDLFIGPISENELDDADWFNHSCEPNAGLRGQITLVAMRDIKSGEEITFDYCMSCSQIGDKRILFNCDCGLSNCRKEITNQDWRMPGLQKKYKGYFSTFVQKNIDKFKL
jgi:SET domain-containing protein